MAKPRMHLVSNFGAAIAAGEMATRNAVEKAVNAGADTAKERISKQAGSRGYNLDASDLKQKVEGKEGGFGLDEFYWRFFEYGTVHIPAMPSIRPGSRKMRKVFRQEMGDNFEKWIAARAGMRRRGL